MVILSLSDLDVEIIRKALLTYGGHEQHNIDDTVSSFDEQVNGQTVTRSFIRRFLTA